MKIKDYNQLSIEKKKVKALINIYWINKKLLDREKFKRLNQLKR